MLEQEFRDLVAEKGFPEPSDHSYAANNDADMHTHDFHVMLYFLEGNFELVLENETIKYGPGDFCELTAGVLHTERTGPSGAKALLSRLPA